MESTSWLAAPRAIEYSRVARAKAMKSRKPGFCMKFQHELVLRTSPNFLPKLSEPWLLTRGKDNDHKYFAELPSSQNEIKYEKCLFKKWIDICS